MNTHTKLLAITIALLTILFTTGADDIRAAELEAKIYELELRIQELQEQVIEKEYVIDTQSETLTRLSSNTIELGERVVELKTELQESTAELQSRDSQVKDLEELIQDIQDNNPTYMVDASAYTLMYSATGRTATGYDLNGKDINERVIAVDPNIIPLGSKVYLSFTDPYTHMTGWYKAQDTGGAIKGRKIDIFFGSAADNNAALQFGRRQVEVITVAPNN